MEATYRQSYLGAPAKPAREESAAPDVLAMSLQEIGMFMDRIEARGVAFVLDGDRLTIATPPGALTPKDEAELVRHRQEIARLVRSAVTPWGEGAPAKATEVSVQLTIGKAA